MRKIVVTGSAGFIGARVSEMLLEEGYQVVGVEIILMIITMYNLNCGVWRN